MKNRIFRQKSKFFDIFLTVSLLNDFSSKKVYFLLSIGFLCKIKFLYLRFIGRSDLIQFIKDKFGTNKALLKGPSECSCTLFGTNLIFGFLMTKLNILY